jgi:penicillin amidase
MKRLQRDVSARAVLGFRDLIISLYDHGPHDRDMRRYTRPVMAALRQWDGVYDADSAGALAFETVETYLADALHTEAEKVAYASVWHTRDLIEASLRNTPSDRAARVVARVIEHTVPLLRRYRVWGAVHRLRLRHPLGLLPLIGGRFKFGEWGVGGSDDTVMKTGTRDKVGPHGVPYGSIARHISDLSDEDENYFCLLGGQDGWFGSDTMLDQVEYWQHGRYLRFGMRQETIERDFPHVTVLRP